MTYFSGEDNLQSREEEEEEVVSFLMKLDQADSVCVWKSQVVWSWSALNDDETAVEQG